LVSTSLIQHRFHRPPPLLCWLAVPLCVLTDEAPQRVSPLVQALDAALLLAASCVCVPRSPRQCVGGGALLSATSAFNTRARAACGQRSNLDVTQAPHCWGPNWPKSCWQASNHISASTKLQMILN
jgi:hypothetical protein